MAATTAAGVRLISFDRAGYGGSDRAPDRTTYADFVPDTIGLINELGIDRLAVVGWSGGTAHAVSLAVAHPGRVTALALCCFADPAKIPASDGDQAAVDAMTHAV